MKNKKKIKLPLILIILILIVSVGYALLTSEGSIHGLSMLADSKWDIHFTNLIVNEDSTDLSEEDSAAVITEDNTQVTYRVTLNKPGDFYEFTVDVKNFGTIDGMVNLLTSTMSIDGEEAVEIAEDKSNLPEYLDYSITYSDGTKIDKNHELKTGEYETYKVRVEFKKDITADQLPTEVKTILFNITPEFTQANEQAIEKPSPFITRASAEGLNVMDFDIDYDKCMEMFGEDVPDDLDAGAYCRGEDITYQEQTLNLKQQLSYYPSYYEEMGLVKNIKYGKVESYEINHDGCVNYLRNNGEEDEEQIELVCTGNTATIFGQEINLNNILENHPEYIGEYVAVGVVNATYTETKPPKIITGYEGDIPKNLVIPKTINGSTVIGIEEEVFKDKGIETVSIPNTVEFIGRKAFDGNNLKNVTLEDNNIEVGTCSFGKKESITTNNLPENYYCETIYWALQDNNNDNTNETLVISDSEVNGNEQGDLDGDTWFYEFSDVPWVKVNSSNSSNNKSYNVSNVVIEGSPKPESTAYWFEIVGYNATTFEADLENLDTSEVTNMSYMFSNAGYEATTFKITGLNNWDTSKVTNMSEMFSSTGYNSSTWDVGDLSNWNTSKVTSMSEMFSYTGYNSSTWNVGDLSNWDTSNVVYMYRMFESAGYNVSTFDINYIENWDTSNVEYISSMFEKAGFNATTWDIGDLSNWNTSKVMGMKEMFNQAGYNATTWNIGNLSEWDTSKVTDMSRMFFSTGSRAATWSIGDLSDWDTSKVTDMSYMFEGAGRNTTTWNIGDLSNWNTSKVTDMRGMFNSTGYNATAWDIGNLSNWDTSNVTDMSYMFEGAGYNATTLNIDLSNWDTSKVTDISIMFSNAGYNATTLNIDLCNWDTSNVKDMRQMFHNIGYNANSVILSINNWDTSGVNYINSMFSYAGYNATTLNIDLSNWNISHHSINEKEVFKKTGENAGTFSLNLSGWNTSKLTDMGYMFYSVGQNATALNLDLSNWDTSKVTNMYDMFGGAGRYSTSFNLDLSNWDTSKVTNMNAMFSAAGSNATTFKITIPQTNGNSISNDTSHMYGSTTDTYASPPRGKSFTLAST